MKSLNDLERDIERLKEEICCQETGNDSYCLSPLYHKHLLKLEALEKEEMVLKGKIEPAAISLDTESAEKKHILAKMAEENGIWFAGCFATMSTEELRSLTSETESGKQD